jgi:hypothetical protein
MKVTFTYFVKLWQKVRRKFHNTCNEIYATIDTAVANAFIEAVL